MYFVLQCVLVQKGGYVLKHLINSCLFWRVLDQTLKPHITQTDSKLEPVQVRLDFYSIITQPGCGHQIRPQLRDLAIYTEKRVGCFIIKFEYILMIKFHRTRKL